MPQTATSEAARTRALADVQRIAAEQALLLPLFHEQLYRFARPEVDGLAIGFGQPIVQYENLSIRG